MRVVARFRDETKHRPHRSGDLIVWKCSKSLEAGVTLSDREMGEMSESGPGCLKCDPPPANRRRIEHPALQRAE